ncbi:hypothetical protein LVJ94_27085 [Pendulispora rubella]|uniref:Uncharacterized protein n=1 Tax=Pendulispora rubella TaxID=2741070 RepID=A0ABZ2KPX7_9BACT
MIRSNWFRAGAIALLAASFGALGCASGDSGTSSSDPLMGDHGTAAPAQAKAKSHSGRAVALSVDAKPFGLGNYGGLNVADTGALDAAGTPKSWTLTGVNADNLAQYANLNASAKGTDSGSHAASASVNGTVFEAAPEGSLLADLFQPGGGGIVIDLSKLLQSLGLSDLIDDLVGKNAPDLLKLMIRYDVIQQDADASCTKGGPVTSAKTTVTGLTFNGKPIVDMTAVPNSTVYDLKDFLGLNLGYITINAQSAEGGSIDSAAVVINLLDIVEIKLSRASAGVECAGGDH